MDSPEADPQNNEQLFNSLKCIQLRITRREAALQADYEKRASIVGQLIAPYCVEVDNG